MIKSAPAGWAEAGKGPFFMTLVEHARGAFGAAAAAAILLTLLAACDRSDGGAERAAPPAANVVAPAEAAAVPPPADPALNQVAGEGEAGTGGEDAAAPDRGDGERRGPSRQARCQIDDEPERSCTFTPVLGDGSFDIEMPERQLRLVVDGDQAVPFELIGARRIPILGLLRRDRDDRACWLGTEEDSQLRRVCAR